MNNHKKILKSALTENYQDILKGKKMETKKSGFNFKALGIAFAAVAILAGGIAGLNLKDVEITSRKAFAEAQMYYENASSQGRYLYQKAIIKQDIGDNSFFEGLNKQWSGDMTAERWIDTENGNEISKVTTEDGTIVDEYMIVDDQYYWKDHGQFDFTEQFDLDGNPIDFTERTPEQIAVDDFYNDATVSESNPYGFPNGFVAIGFNSYEEIDSADLSSNEIDDLLEAAGYPRVSDPNLYSIPCFEDDQELCDKEKELRDLEYTTKPSEYDAAGIDEMYTELYGDLFSVGGDYEFDAQAEYEACKASEDTFAKTAKLDIFYDGKAKPQQYAEVFEELADDDFFTVEESTWNGRDVVALSYSHEDAFVDIYEGDKSDVSFDNSETLYLNKDTYSLVGIESIFGSGENASSFNMEIIEEEYSDDPIDFSTEGFESDGDIFGDFQGDISDELDIDLDIELGDFGCESILEAEKEFSGGELTNEEALQL